MIEYSMILLMSPAFHILIVAKDQLNILASFYQTAHHSINSSNSFLFLSYLKRQRQRDNKHSILTQKDEQNILLSVVALASARRPFRWHSDLSIYNKLTDEALFARSEKHLLRSIQYQWFTQRLDHFNTINQQTFQQRYVINDQYWNGKGPVFIMINGEGPMSLATVTGLQFVNWAQQSNALIISLEHRYYGASFATDDLSTDNLAYLTPQQALADNAAFREFVAVTFNVPATSKWVSFGGSYSGCLTSWFRIKYPNLVDYTVASSGPVNAEVNFYQYLEVVQNSLLTATNGQQCVSNIAQATQKIQALLSQPNGLETVSDMFNLFPALESQNDVANFMQSLAGNFMGVVQYNLEEVGPSVETLCQTMTDSSNDALTNYIAIWNQYAQGETLDVSYDTMISELTNVTNDQNIVGGRQWFFQTCAQFGFYQTSDSPNQPFGNLFPLEFQIQQCSDVFGFDFLPNVNWTLLDFGGLNPVTSNVIYVNGDIDPWHSLGITASFPAAGENTETILIHGTAHCADMMMPTAGVSPSTLAPAQTIIGQQIQSFLSQN
ncbi:hypothetical protein DFA_05930 [Cavenderia fasciculata]|uniref:Peptidase S28 family protein n=1 Tax=Cavenderia fasciculata TaxID=261658 RepID=F4PJM0_CACFS|nr:uncharacterized protein DFA_05930 [Cavenderia fasciculata]EGG23794.1 hypothetical protein DFA_05930 [Cavenderia fasciculata]|eukprot:XP_004361645.1 hypothetical protein DFA_05930 [Cavenderia fasciculata]